MNEQKNRITFREIRKVSETHTTSIRDLTTADGQPFQLQEIEGFINAVTAQQLANKGPLLIRADVEIKDSHGSWITKKPVLLVVSHGFRIGNEHKMITNTSSLLSDEIMKSIVMDRESRGESERIALMVSCDSDTQEPRWDDSQLARTLGIVGFSGNINHMTSKFGEELFYIDSTDLRSPFEDAINHQNSVQINPQYSPFKRKTLRLS